MDGERTVGLTVVTGFLGAGKTTLLNQALEDPELRDTAVIINEFGDIALDHLLVETAEDGIVELGGGCLCCTVRGALVDTLVALLERTPLPRRVVVETTGLADPVPILQAVMAHPHLSNCYRIDGVTAVIDAVNGAATLDAHAEARAQAAMADRLVITKADMATPDEERATMERLAKLNTAAERYDARASDTASLALRPGAFKATFEAVPISEHHHDGDDHHHHHDHSHEEEFQSISLRHGARLPQTVVENFLDLLVTQQADRLLRIKGLIETVEHPEHPLLIQGAQRLLHAPQRLAQWPDGERGTRLVVIGRNLDKDYVRRLFSAFTGQAAIDTPDRQAFENNPLAISGFRP